MPRIYFLIYDIFRYNGTDLHFDLQDKSVVNYFF